MEYQTSIYTVYYSVQRLDQAARYTASSFSELPTAYGIKLNFSKTQFHNSIGLREKYYRPLYLVLDVLRHRHPSLGPILLLYYAVEKLNDTRYHDSLVPSLLFFKNSPIVPIPNKYFLDKRMVWNPYAQPKRKQQLFECKKESTTRYNLVFLLPLDKT